VSRAPLIALAWAALLAVHTTVLIAFGGDELPVLLLGGAAAGAALLGLWLAWRGRRPGRPVPELSRFAALAGVSVAALVIGAELGTWLLLIAAGALALAVFGLLHERREAARRAREVAS